MLRHSHQPQPQQQLVPPGQIQRQPSIVTPQQQPAQPQGKPQSSTSKIITQQRGKDLGETINAIFFLLPSSLPLPFPGLQLY